MLSIEIPDQYGWVLLTVGALPTLTNFMMMGPVMVARKKYNVKYPNLYATPGHHEKADEFNRVQRGHQHLFETISDFRVNALIGGLKYPVLTACCGVAYSVGSYLYMMGYADNKNDVKLARYKKGGGLKWIGSLVVMGCSIMSAVSFLK